MARRTKLQKLIRGGDDDGSARLFEYEFVRCIEEAVRPAIREWLDANISDWMVTYPVRPLIDGSRRILEHDPSGFVIMMVSEEYQTDLFAYALGIDRHI